MRDPQSIANLILLPYSINRFNAGMASNEAKNQLKEDIIVVIEDHQDQIRQLQLALANIHKSIEPILLTEEYAVIAKHSRNNVWRQAQLIFDGHPAPEDWKLTYDADGRPIAGGD